MRARHFLLFLLLSITVAASAFGQCANIVAVNASLGDSTDGPTAGIVFVTLDATAACGQTIPAITAGDGVAITSGGKQFEAAVKEVIPSAGLFTRIEAIAGGPAAEDADTLDQLTTNAPATVKIGTASFDAKIINANLPLLNITRYEWSLGPATKATTNDSGGTGAAETNANDSAEGAFRLQYDGEYARPGFLGRGSSASKFQTIGTLSIDTTNSEDPGYIDNNRLAVGVRSIELPITSFLAQARAGIEGSLTRSFHQEAQDGDVMATFSTWIPALRSKTFFSSIPDYISPPLAISLSYGYRNKQVPGAKTISGRSGEATATYFLYAFDDYQLTLSGTWTLNDMSDRPATMKRTSRLYRIGVAHMTDPAKGFEVVTSFEDGSIGPLLTKVRQYYIGIATKKFSMSGGSK